MSFSRYRYRFIFPVITGVVIGFLFFNQFSCQKNDSGGVSVFGNSDESPMKSQLKTSQAVELQTAFRQIFEMYRESVVFITTEQTVRVRPHPFFNDPWFGNFSAPSRVQKKTGLGTGFVISRDGYICTNYHVIDGVDRVFVKVNEKNHEAKIIGGDKRTDLALLKITSNESFKPVYFGDSDTVNVGDWAIAIGNPFGLDRTFTVGVISAVGRSDVDLLGTSHLQTDASINPGNSGGPLINIYGEVIGINRMIYSKSGGYMGIGFAIPVNTARSILAQLKTHREVKRGYLGVGIMELNERTAAELGLKSVRGTFISEVISGSPADKAGIRVGDVILEVSGERIENYKDLLRVIGETKIGSMIRLVLWRNGSEKTVAVEITGRPSE